MRMDSMRLSLLFVAPALLAVSSGAWADTVTFLAVPADVSGPAGSTVGWGYSITNDSTNYLDITGIDSDLFLAADGTPDSSIFNFPNVAPGQTVVQVYDPADLLGLFQFTWNSDVPVGTTETGNFTLYGAFCSGSDPFCADDLSVPSVALASAAYSATVTAPTGGPSVPEPSPILWLMVWIGVAALGRRLQRNV